MICIKAVHSSSLLATTLRTGCVTGMCNPHEDCPDVLICQEQRTVVHRSQVHALFLVMWLIFVMEDLSGNFSHRHELLDVVFVDELFDASNFSCATAAPLPLLVLLQTQCCHRPRHANPRTTKSCACNTGKDNTRWNRLNTWMLWRHSFA